MNIITDQLKYAFSKYSHITLVISKINAFLCQNSLSCIISYASASCALSILVHCDTSFCTLPLGKCNYCIPYSYAFCISHPTPGQIAGTLYCTDMYPQSHPKMLLAIGNCLHHAVLFITACKIGCLDDIGFRAHSASTHIATVRCSMYRSSSNSSACYPWIALIMCALVCWIYWGELGVVMISEKGQEQCFFL